MMLNDTKKSSKDISDRGTSEVAEADNGKMDLLLEVIESEKLIANSVEEHYGVDASHDQYSVEHISLEGDSMDSISLDINEFKV